MLLLIHLQKCQHCGFSTLFNIIWKKNFSQIYLLLMDSQFFVDAPLNSNSSYFLLNKNINFSKIKTESKMENLTQTYVNEESCFSPCKNHKSKWKRVEAREIQKCIFCNIHLVWRNFFYYLCFSQYKIYILYWIKF